MKTMRAKALASLLAGFVTLAGFSGCHASSAAMFSESATISASSAPQDSASSTTQIPQTSEAGTYVQDDMTELMPQTYAYFTDLRLSADGAVEVVGLEPERRRTTFALDRGCLGNRRRIRPADRGEQSFDRRGRRHALDRLPR